MSKYLPLFSSLVSSLLFVAACGDDSSTVEPGEPDAGQPQPDADPPEEPVCDASSYPQAVRPVSISLGDPIALELDGNGARCDQIVRALTNPDPTKRPEPLAELDAEGATWTCNHDDVLDREIVRMRFPKYAGLPLYAPAQEVLVHVSADPAMIVFMLGDYLAAGSASAPAACFDGDEIAATIPGRTLEYTQFALCRPQGKGSYEVAANDEVEAGEEGYLVDDDGNLRRVRVIDVYLHPDNVTDDAINSNLFCCTGPSLEHCVGQRLYMDSITGEFVIAGAHCRVC